MSLPYLIDTFVTAEEKNIIDSEKVDFVVILFGKCVLFTKKWIGWWSFTCYVPIRCYHQFFNSWAKSHVCTMFTEQPSEFRDRRLYVLDFFCLRQILKLVALLFFYCKSSKVQSPICEFCCFYPFHFQVIPQRSHINLNEWS